MAPISPQRQSALFIVTPDVSINVDKKEEYYWVQNLGHHLLMDCDISFLRLRSIDEGIYHSPLGNTPIRSIDKKMYEWTITLICDRLLE